MDEQTFMVRFESMRKPVTVSSGKGTGGTISGSGGRRQLLVTHAELGRQCRSTVRGYEYDSRMVEMQRRRDVRAAEMKQAKLRADMWRLKREKPRLRESVEADIVAHEQQHMRRVNVEKEIMRRSSEQKKLDVEDMLELVEGLPLPAHVKRNMEQPILAGEFNIKC